MVDLFLDESSLFPNGSPLDNYQAIIIAADSEDRVTTMETLKL